MKPLPTLVLDDERYRLDAFRNKLGSQDVVYVSYVQEAVDALNKTHRFETMYLDHDLGIGVAGNGMDVVKAICALPDDRLPSEVYVHSMNTVAGKKMVLALRDRGIRSYYNPFHMLGLV